MHLWLLLLGVFPYGWGSPEESGYVVKTERERLYLDLGEGAGAVPGREFVVFDRGEELVHPVTRASLGREEKVLARGAILEVHPKYSVGRLSEVLGEVKPGSHVRWEGRGKEQENGQSEEASALPLWKSPPLDMVLIGMDAERRMGRREWNWSSWGRGGCLSLGIEM